MRARRLAGVRRDGRPYHPAGMSPPLVSVIIPVHNGRAFIADALRSVFDQTYPAIECIVVDDGSTDGTAEVVAASVARAICVRQPRRGVSAARNAGAEAASGELLAFLDADDVWMPQKLSAQAEKLSQGAYPMAMCATEVVDQALHPVGSLTMSLPAAQPLLGMVVFGAGTLVSCGSTALIERAAFDRLAGFDTNLSTSADWDFLARYLLIFGNVTFVDRPLSRYRRHDANMSRRIDVTERDMRYAYRELFGRPELPAAIQRRRREAHASMRLMLAGSYWEAGERDAALRNAAAALAWKPSATIGLLRRARRSLSRRSSS